MPDAPGGQIMQPAEVVEDPSIERIQGQGIPGEAAPGSGFARRHSGVHGDVDAPVPDACLFSRRGREMS